MTATTATTTPTKTDLIAELRAAGCELAESTLKRKSVDALLELLAEQSCGGCDNGEHCGACECCPADDAEPALTPDYVFPARGNYNTVWVPVAEALAADPRHAVRTWTDKQSVMLVNVNIVGSGAHGFHSVLEQIETGALAALRDWQKTQDRKSLTDMEKYNQNRSFLAGYGAAVVRRVNQAKKAPAIAFARDMDKALRPEAHAAGLAAGKESEAGK